MNKQDLVKLATSKVEGVTQKDMAVALDAFVESIKETIATGEKITLVGFGTFEVVERAARKGRNPQTGKEMDISASKAPKFKASSTFKNMVNA